MNIKKNIALIVGVSIPILMIVLVAAVIYLPRLFYHPAYNFLYATSDDFYATQQYDVQDGKLIKKDVRRYGPSTPLEEAKLYIHDVATNQNKEVSFSEAQQLNLDPDRQSPDGFEIVTGDHRGDFFPFSFSSDSDYCSRYISGHNVSRKLDLKRSSNAYCDGVKFIGWIQ